MFPRKFLSLEGIVVSNHIITARPVWIECYLIVSSLLIEDGGSNTLHIRHIPRRIRGRIRVPKHSFSQLIGNDLINLLLRVISLIHALGQYADTKNHDDDGHHQDNKKDYAGFIIKLFELRKHLDLLFNCFDNCRTAGNVRALS